MSRSLDPSQRLLDPATGRWTEAAWHACEKAGVPPLALHAATDLPLPGLEQLPKVRAAMAHSVVSSTVCVEEAFDKLPVEVSWNPTTRRAVVSVKHSGHTVQDALSGQVHAHRTTTERGGGLPQVLVERAFVAYKAQELDTMRSALMAAMPSCTTTVAGSFQPTTLRPSLETRVRTVLAMRFGSRYERYRAMAHNTDIQAAMVFGGLSVLGGGLGFRVLNQDLFTGIVMLCVAGLLLGCVDMFYASFSKAMQQACHVQRADASPTRALPSQDLE